MLRKEITFENFEGEKVTKPFHFHLTKAEIIELVAGYPDDFTGYVKRIAQLEKKEELISLFRKIVLKSYGVRDGDSFKKTEALSEEFSHTEAYSELFVELFSDTDKSIAFFNALLSVDLQNKLASETSKTKS